MKKELLNNLTLLQIEYLRIDTMKDNNRLEDLKELLTALQVKKFNHNNKDNYTYTINESYRIKTSYSCIDLYYNNYIDTTFTKWKYTQLENRIKNDIYYIEYLQLENKVKELYYKKVAGNWLNEDQFKNLSYLLKSFYLYPSTRSRVKRDKITNTLYIDYSLESYTCIKDNGNIHYNMNSFKIVSKIDLLKNKIDLQEIEKTLKEFYNYDLIPIRYINVEKKTDKEDNYKIQICDRIDKSIEAVKEYFYNNTYNNLTGRDEYNYSIV